MILFLCDIYLTSRKRRHQELIPRDTELDGSKIFVGHKYLKERACDWHG